MDLIIIKEGCAFLLAQRDGRRTFLGPVDKELPVKEACSAKHMQEEQTPAMEALVSNFAA